MANYILLLSVRGPLVRPYVCMLFALAAFIPSGVRAEWNRVEITSDRIAARGGILLGVAAVATNRPDSSTVTVQYTYWKWDGVIYRCFDSTYQGWQGCEKAVDSPEPNTD